jgi:P27 family predicted phage terminase small subunit
MGKRGPAPKPTQLKILEGNRSKRPLNRREPVPPAGKVAPPAWLLARGRDSWAMKAWRRLAPRLQAMGVLTTVDTEALGLLCDTLALYLETSEVVAEKGATYRARSTTGRVIIKTRPEVAIAADAYKRVKSMMAEFGLTPSARSRVVTTKAESRDPFEEFLAGRQSS